MPSLEEGLLALDVRVSHGSESAFHGSGLQAIEQAKAKGSDPTHGAEAAVARAAANVERKREVREWHERYGKLTDLSAFQREFLPLIQDVPLSRLQRASGLSLRYVSLIRRGETRTPKAAVSEQGASGARARRVGGLSVQRGGAFRWGYT